MVDDWNVNTEQWWNDTHREHEKYLPHCHFVYHKSQEISNSKNSVAVIKYEGWNFNSGNYLFTTDTK